jgi:hypothetical protein
MCELNTTLQNLVMISCTKDLTSGHSLAIFMWGTGGEDMRIDGNIQMAEYSRFLAKLKIHLPSISRQTGLIRIPVWGPLQSSIIELNCSYKICWSNCVICAEMQKKNNTTKNCNCQCSRSVRFCFVRTGPGSCPVQCPVICSQFSQQDNFSQISSKKVCAV